MRKLIIEKFYTPITIEKIQEFENIFSLKLPEYLKELIFEYNGASTTECVFLLENNTYIINNFLPLLINKNASVEQILPAVIDSEEGIGRKDLIPFAIDPGGRPYYVSIGGQDEGVIYYDLIGMGSDEPLRVIASSLEEFINGLKREDELP